MKEKRLHRIISRFVDIRPDEAPTAVRIFFYFFLITFPAYIIKPVKVSLYLSWFTNARLPYAYLLTAVVIGFVVALNTRLLNRFERRRYISLSQLFFMANLVAFWFLFKLHWPWLSLLYWLWSDIFIATSVTQFWIAVNDIYNPHQARRLVGFFVSGGLLGGIGGSILASRLAKTIGTENLLLVCPAIIFLSMAVVNGLYARQPKEKVAEGRAAPGEKKKPTGYLESFNLVRKSRYLLLLSGLVTAAIIVSTLIDFQFNSVVKETIAAKDARTSFLGTFFGAVLVVSYILHVLFTSLVLKKFGIRVVILFSPLILFVGAWAIFLVPVAALIYWAIAVKGADKALDHTLSQAVRELLYIPIQPEVKYKAKIFIDMFVNKFASAFGACLILIFFTALKFSLKQMSFITIPVTGIWILFALALNREYVGIVKRNLKIKWQDADTLVSQHVDRNLTKLIFDTIQSREKSSVLYAMNLFDLIQKEKLTPELKKIISYESDVIRAKALDSLLDVSGESFVPEIADTLDDEELDVQVREIMALDVYQSVIQDRIHLVVGQGKAEGEADRMEAAKLLGMMAATAPVVEDLDRLIIDESPEVAKYAIESAARLKKPEFIPLIIRQLKNAYVHEVATDALIDYGEAAIEMLRVRLLDPREDLGIRRAIPDILGAIGTSAAANALAQELAGGREDVEAELIDALYKLKSNHQDLCLPEKIVLPALCAKIKKSYLVLMEIDKLLLDEKKNPLVKDLENSLSRSLKHIFELLGLIYPFEDIRKAYQNICAGTKKSTDFSLELLDNILKKDLKECLLPLVEDIPFDEKVRRCRKLERTLERASFDES